MRPACPERDTDIGKGKYRECESARVVMGGSENSATNANSGKKRKLQSEFKSLENLNLPESSVAPAIAATSGCSQLDGDNQSSSSDLKSEEFGTKMSTFISICRKTKSSSMDSSSQSKRKPSSPGNTEDVTSPALAITPTMAELEEFFTSAEKYEQERFAEKYNYDTVKDVPLEGDYNWVRLKP